MPFVPPFGDLLHHFIIAVLVLFGEAFEANVTAHVITELITLEKQQQTRLTEGAVAPRKRQLRWSFSFFGEFCNTVQTSI